MAKFAALVEQEKPGGQLGVLRLVTGGSPTRPIAVNWRERADGAGEEIYRGSPSADMAEAQTQETCEKFDEKVTELRSQGWRIIGVDGRNLFVQLG